MSGKVQCSFSRTLFLPVTTDDLQFLLLSGLEELFGLHHVFFRSTITNRVKWETGPLMHVQ